ncbi:MAG: cobamide remodeling phosphodiesterase CbiR, partial [Spirochaetia bacterium]
RDRGDIESVELLFFLFDGDTEELLTKEIAGIREESARLGITVHLPDDLTPEHEKIVELTSDFVRHYVVHPPPGNEDLFVEIVSSWRERYGDRFLLENLIGRSFESLLERFDGKMPVCCDTGHLLVRGESPSDFLARYGARIREIHLHGLDEGWDHNPFFSDEPWFVETAPHLEEFDGIVNIEVFKEDHLKRVLDSLRKRKLIS